MDTPIAKAESLAEQAYRYLRTQILTGNIPPGSKLVESQMAKRWKISRSPLREAIRRLEQEGLVVTYNGVTHLFEPSRKDFEDLYELRTALEPMAARLAARYMTADALQQLEAVLESTDKYLAAGAMDPFIESNAKFHDLIAESSGNRRLRKAMEDISVLARYYRYICFKVFQRYVDSAEEHWRIYRALLAHDEDLAWLEMKKHIEVDLQYIRTEARAVHLGG